MSHIFISYSHKDKDYVHKLQVALQNEGLDVWIDDRIDYGTTWPKVIQQHLDDCAAFIVVMTEDAYESVWVQNEVTRAQRKKKPFFALLLKSEPWLAVEAIQYEDVTGNKLPSKKFYDSLALIIPRQEKAESKKLLERPFQAKHELLTRKSFPVWLVVLGIIFIVIVVVILATHQHPSTPAPAATATFTALPIATETLSATASPLPTETVTPELPTITPATQTSTLGIGSTMFSPKDDMTLMYVPAGNFTMGSDIGYADEKPAHQVYLDAFWIDKTDVTNAMYAKCVADKGACQPPSNSSSYTRSSYYGNSEFDNYPVIYVSWNDATVYCKWAGRQLPIEAQWEKAARGTNGRIYPWGNNEPNDNLLNYNWHLGDTTQVGKYPDGASPYGALDMAGNVWQWVNDWYSATYYQISPSLNPLGISSGQTRVLRGGSWAFIADQHQVGVYIDIVRSTFRNWTFSPDTSSKYIGFRCAMSAAS